MSGDNRGSQPACPVCAATKREYLFVIQGLPVCRCPNCNLLMVSPQPSELHASGAFDRNMESKTEHDAAERLVTILKERGCHQGDIVLIAAKDHIFAQVVQEHGYRIAQHLTVRDLEAGAELITSADAVVMLSQLECSHDPAALLDKLKQSLALGALLLMNTISVDAWPRHFFGPRWTEWRAEHLFYFNPNNLHGLLLRHGFGQIWVEPDERMYSLKHVRERVLDCPQTFVTRAIRFAYAITPPPFRWLKVRLSTSGIIVTARRCQTRERPLVSIVVPAYNEKNTIAILLTELTKKQLADADKEIIVVESNSKDGTREVVAEFEKHPEVRVIYQDRPMGKGFAVRSGFEQARGDIVMIQDADLEYDLNDYDSLLEPLLANRTAFVLGARHGGDWKMRKFNDQNSMATLLNVGHVFFTLLLNTLFRQRLRDPFTMFKVFRRDCLYGQKFYCNRFDFDFELVIKLVRRGFIPIEIPVNYDSRSFKEGKKVRVIRDPISWIWACIKLRLERAPSRPIELPTVKATTKKEMGIKEELSKSAK